MAGSLHCEWSSVQFSDEAGQYLPHPALDMQALKVHGWLWRIHIRFLVNKQVKWIVRCFSAPTTEVSLIIAMSGVNRHCLVHSGTNDYHVGLIAA